MDIYDQYREQPQGCGTAIAGAVGLVLIAVLLIFSSCSPKVLTNTIEKERIVREVVRDTTVVTKPDSAAIHALFECDSTNQVVLRQLETMQGERIKPTIIVKHTNEGTQVEFDCKEDSLIHEIELRDKIIEEKSKETTVVQVKYVPDYYKNTSAGFWVLLVIIVAYLGYKGYRLYLKFQTGGLL